VWFSLLLYSHTTVRARQDKAFTVLADLASVFCWQANFGSHGYFSREFHVTLCQRRVFMIGFVCQSEERLDALHRYALTVVIHLLHGAPLNKLLRISEISLSMARTIILDGLRWAERKR